MKRISYKGRCEKRKVSKCTEVCRTYDLCLCINCNTESMPLLWEGGGYSLQQMMLNIVSDKVELCQKMGIAVEEKQWPVSALPGVMVTDMGSEYIGETFEQITELGVTLINLPSFRPDLKGPIEKLFDMVQEKFKDALKGKGVIKPDLVRA